MIIKYLKVLTPTMVQVLKIGYHVHVPGRVTDRVTDAKRRMLDELRIYPGYSYFYN